MGKSTVFPQVSFSVILLAAGIILSIIFKLPDGSPNPAWIQVGASLSLIYITYPSVSTTQHALSESQAIRRNTDQTLKGAICQE